MFKFSGSPGENLQRRRVPGGHWKNCVGWMRQPHGVRPGEASGVTVAAGASASPTSSARASSVRKAVGSPSAPMYLPARLRFRRRFRGAGGMTCYRSAVTVVDAKA